MLSSGAITIAPYADWVQVEAVLLVLSPVPSFIGKQLFIGISLRG
ncbi:MAG: hypothetical protein AWT59_2228 [Candidatus Gallionella acididurans]|uniref:Uncharacterized protein n=1 Tax=Candidatus Gallionella acididurans TaxID=1796491 RepID=A0A139BRJ7_9PROT|nr:MAG: hypothetical protein AWT59_2228 [Candidatus Gallionella acididurans]